MTYTHACKFSHRQHFIDTNIDKFANLSSMQNVCLFFFSLLLSYHFILQTIHAQTCANIKYIRFCLHQTFSTRLCNCISFFCASVCRIRFSFLFLFCSDTDINYSLDDECAYCAWKYDNLLLNTLTMHNSSEYFCFDGRIFF